MINNLDVTAVTGDDDEVTVTAGQVVGGRLDGGDLICFHFKDLSGDPCVWAMTPSVAKRLAKGLVKVLRRTQR